MAVRKVLLHRVMEPSLAIRVVQAESVYPQIGMLNFGRGTFKKSDLLGSETKYPTLQQVRAGQVIYSKLKAFEGALSIVPAEHDKHFVSQEFPTFDLNRDEVDPSYLLEVFRSEPFAEQLARGSKGVGARRERLHPRAFLNIEIPLPSIEEQRGIAVELQSVQDMIAKVRGVESGAPQLDRAYLVREAGSVFARLAGAPSWKVGEDIELRSGGTPDVTAFAYWGSDVPWVTPTDVGQLRARTIEASAKKLSWEGARKYPVVPEGAVIMTSRAPIGNLAIAGRELRTNQGCKSFVPANGMLSEYLYFGLVASLPEIHRRGSGTTFHEVSMSKLKGLAVPQVSLAEQLQVVEHLDGIENNLRATESLMSKRNRLLAALPKAVRNEIFSNLV